MGHNWIPSPLGHGNQFCTKCNSTDLEIIHAGVRGMTMNRCLDDPVEKPLLDFKAVDTPTFGATLSADRKRFIHSLPRQDNVVYLCS